MGCPVATLVYRFAVETGRNNMSIPASMGLDDSSACQHRFLDGLVFWIFRYPIDIPSRESLMLKKPRIEPSTPKKPSIGDSSGSNSGLVLF